MHNNYCFDIKNPNFEHIGYVVAVAKLDDKHDRSAPSDHHWKILKCRMIIFSNSSVMACPDRNEVKRVHVVFNKLGDDYDKLTSLFIKFLLTQEGGIRNVTKEIFQMCFQYTLTAKIAPDWNTVGYNYLINNREFLTAIGPQDGMRYQITSTDHTTTIELKPVKINFIKTDEDFFPGEWIRVLPSLNKAVVEECYRLIPVPGEFKAYKDLRRHWKNIHGYRLPEEDPGKYYLVRFWRGDPLTYPKYCVKRNFPTIIPMPKNAEKVVLAKFINCMKNKMAFICGTPLTLSVRRTEISATLPRVSTTADNSQAISLCTPTQHPARFQ